MEKIKSMLECNNVNINDLVVEDWGDRFHIGFRSKTPVINSGASDVKVLVETLDKEGNYKLVEVFSKELNYEPEYFNTIVFPTQESLLKTFRYLRPHNNMLDSYKTFIRECIELVERDNKITLTDIALYLYSEDIEVSDYLVEKISEIEEKLYKQDKGINICCVFNDLAECYRIKVEDNNALLSQSTLDKMITDSRLSKDEDCTLFLDKDTPEQFWSLDWPYLCSAAIEDLLFLLTPEEKEEALKEIKQTKEAGMYIDENIDKMPLCSKALTLFLQEILNI